MNNYNYDDEMREEQLAKEIGRKFAELGFGTVQTEEEQARSKKYFKKKEKRDKFFGSVFSGLRTIIYTPLSIAFHAVSFVAKGIGYISSFGLIAGVYYLYQSFCAFKSGVPFGEIGELSKAVGFIVFPFIAYIASRGKIYTLRSIFTRLLVVSLGRCPLRPPCYILHNGKMIVPQTA